MKTRKHFVLGAVAFVVVAGLLVQANSKQGSVTPHEIQSLIEGDFVKPCSKEIGKVRDREAFLQGVFFAHEVVEHIRNEVALRGVWSGRPLKEYLAGLESVRVLVGVLPNAEKCGLTEELLQTDTELRLRTHGITVAGDVQPQHERATEQNSWDSIHRELECWIEAKSDEDFLRSAREWVRRGHLETFGQPPALYVSVLTIVSEETGNAAFEMEVRLMEEARICRNYALCNAAKWLKVNMGIVPSSQLKECVRECLRDMVDEFINDYLAANPKDRSSEETQ